MKIESSIKCGYKIKSDVSVEGFIYVGFKNKNVKGEKFITKDRVFNIICYLLGHCGVSPQKHSLKYFGQANNSKFKTAALLSNSPDSITDINSLIDTVAEPKLNPVFLDTSKEHVKKHPTYNF